VKGPVDVHRQSERTGLLELHEAVQRAAQGAGGVHGVITGQPVPTQHGEDGADSTFTGGDVVRIVGVGHPLGGLVAAWVAVGVGAVRLCRGVHRIPSRAPGRCRRQLPGQLRGGERGQFLAQRIQPTYMFVETRQRDAESLGEGRESEPIQPDLIG